MVTIVITAGHSNDDPGAVAHNLKEAEFAADMRNYVAHYLRKQGFDVATDGAGRTNAPLSKAIELARKAEVAVEFHLNAASPDVYGVEVLGQENHRPLAQAIAGAVHRVTNTKLRGDRGWKPENAGQHKRLGFVRAGGVVVELEFITCKPRMDVLNDKRWLVAKEIATAIGNYVLNKG